MAVVKDSQSQRAVVGYVRDLVHYLTDATMVPTCQIKHSNAAARRWPPAGADPGFFEGGFVLGKISPNRHFFMKNPVILKKFDSLGWFYRTLRTPAKSASDQEILKHRVGRNWMQWDPQPHL